MPGFKGSVMKPAPGRNPCRIGEIPGFPVGSRWPGRRELCDDGVHAHLSSGIHGRIQEGAFSVVLSGGYEDDIDLGNEFTYTGQGGQGKREKGVKWSNVQIADQEWTRGNLALAVSWMNKTPVRVIRGHTLNSPYAPAEGYCYDGLYTVEDATEEKGKRQFQVCLFRFVRCPNQDPLPGPNATLPIRPERPFRMEFSSPSSSRESSHSELSEEPAITTKREPTENNESLTHSSSPTTYVSVTHGVQTSQKLLPKHEPDSEVIDLNRNKISESIQEKAQSSKHQTTALLNHTVNNNSQSKPKQATAASSKIKRKVISELRFKRTSMSSPNIPAYEHSIEDPLMDSASKDLEEGELEEGEFMDSVNADLEEGGLELMDAVNAEVEEGELMEYTV